MSNKRRKFLRWIGYGLLGIVALFFGSMIRSALYRLKAEAGPRYLPLDLPSGVTFHQGIIVNRYKHKYVIMSAIFMPGLMPEGHGVHVKGPWYFVGL